MYERKCQNIYSPYCLWCKDKEEDTEYILIQYSKYEKIRKETEEKIILIITKVDKINNTRKNIKKIILWFKLKNATEKKLIIYLKLKIFDKLAGWLGYI
jgi:GTP-binding protein EngB required for normal cell division